MGAKRKVDEKLYTKIRKELKTPKDDKKVMKKYKIGQSIARAIRNSWCYDDYIAKTSSKKITINSSPRRRLAQVPTRTKENIAFYAFMALACIGLVSIAWMIGRWLISLFTGA